MAIKVSRCPGGATVKDGRSVAVFNDYTAAVQYAEFLRGEPSLGPARRVAMMALDILLRYETLRIDVAVRSATMNETEKEAWGKCGMAAIEAAKALQMQAAKMEMEGLT